MATEYKLSYSAEDIDRRLSEIDKIPDLQSQIDNLSKNQETGVVETEHPFSEAGYYTIYGDIASWEGDPSLNTGYVSLDGIHTIQYIAYLNEFGYEIAFFDMDKNFMPEISVVGTTSFSRKEIDLTESKYDNAAYAIVSNYENISVLCITISGYDSDPNLADNVITKGTKGKTMLIFGDSITETAYMDDDGSNYIEDGWMNWPIYAREILQLEKMWNFAKSGAAYKDRTDVEARQKISHQISSAISSEKPADIIVISAGTNDGGSNIGDYSTAMSKTTLDDLDRTNLYEAIRWAMWKLKTQYPDAVCFAATPIHRADHEPISELTEAITKMANRYNFIVIPAENESGIIRDNEIWQAAGHDLIDGLHPNENGQKKMARLYCNYILNHCIEK